MLCVFFRLDRGSDSEAEDVEHAEKLRQVKAVLEEVISFYDNVFSMIFICIISQPGDDIET